MAKVKPRKIRSSLSPKKRQEVATRARASAQAQLSMENVRQREALEYLQKENERLSKELGDIRTKRRMASKKAAETRKKRFIAEDITVEKPVEVSGLFTSVGLPPNPLHSIPSGPAEIVHTNDGITIKPGRISHGPGSTGWTQPPDIAVSVQPGNFERFDSRFAKT